jgi:hypothetical protein
LSHSISDPSILLLHDGDLADVAALLRELGASITERCGGAAAEDAEQSWRLVVASARRALELPSSLLRASHQRLAILDGESRTVCALLRRASFELIVRRPVHPAALRLLLLHSLYRGKEKRRSPRVSVGAPVHVRAGLRRHPAILAEISERGCRLLSAQRVSVGQTLTLQVPAPLAGGRAFSLKGLVVRATPAQIGAAGVVTLEFDPLRGTQRERVRALVAAHSGGPSALTRGDSIVSAPRAASAAPHSPTVDAMPSAPHPNPSVANESERARSTPLEAIAASLEPEETELEVDLGGDLENDLESALGADSDEEPETRDLPRRLVPLSSEASRVVLARGLSRDGMRADPSQRLARSAELSLALHLEVGGPPIHVRAHVEPAAAGEPEPGPWLRFAELAPGDGERLDALLAGLSIFAGGDGPEHALVVCEILDPPRG